MNFQRVLLGCSLLLGLFLNLFHVSAACAQVSPRVVEAVDDAQRITLKGNVHPLARSEFDRGAVADSQPMNRILLLLKRSDAQEAALQDLLQKQQDKSSPNFHQWLTPAQFGAQFGPADADIQAVSDWLTHQGFSIGKIYSGKTAIEFSGTAAQVQRAFGTAIHNYEVKRKLYSANVSDLQIPAALAPVVAGVVSLHNFPRQFHARRFGTVRRTAGKSVFEPLVTVPNPGGSENFYGVGPGDFAKIYGIPATCGNPAAACTGTGQTIAVVEETNIAVSDVQQFRSVFGLLPANFTAANIILNGEDPGITSTDEESEADLDTEWAGAVAPGATIQFVLSASTAASQGVDLSALYIVENNLAGAMSESYGACEAGLGVTESSFINNLWEQASAQGITVAVSTGDNGSAGCDDPNTENLATQGVAVNGLASTPYDIAVGGTDFDEYSSWSTYWSATNNTTTGTSALGYIPEIPWNQSCTQLGASGCGPTTPAPLQDIVAGAGGPSQQYSKPSWQVGTPGMPADGKRDLPDISLFASAGFNGSGYLYCQEDVGEQCLDSSGFSGSMSFGVIGGTSAGAPAFAGIMALVNQSQATTQNPAPRQGNANYILYALAKRSGASCASSATATAGCIFNDITHGSSALPTGGKGIGTNSVPCQVGTPNCKATAGDPIGILESPSNASIIAWNVGASYDLVTGLGSLNIGNLLSSWATASTVPTTTTLTLNQTTGIAHGSTDVSVTINVTPQSGTATGTASLIALIPTATQGVTTPFAVGEFTLGVKNIATGMTQNLPGGTNQVYAHYSGDGVNAPSDSASQTVSVTPEKSNTFIVVPTFDPSTGNQTNANATSVTYGSQYIIRIYVTNSSGTASATGAPIGACTQTSPVTCPSGTIALTANSNPVDGGTFALNNIGYTRDLSADLPGGTYSLAAAYSGDTSYLPSSVAEAFTVNLAPTTLSAPFDTATILVGGQTYVGANLTTQAYTGVAPTGKVTFYDSGNALLGPVTLNPTAPTGYSPGSLSPVISTTFATSGNHIITAAYSGDANYAAATSNPSTLDVVYPTALSVSESASTVNYGQSVTLTVTITSQGKNPAMTGQVQFSGPGGATFSNITTTPGTDSNGNQMLTVTATAVPQEPGSFYVSYSGDTNYEAASTNPLFINVNLPYFSMTPSPNALTITAGQSASASVSIAPSTSISSTVALTCSNPIVGATCTLNPTSINLANNTSGTTAITLSTLGPSANSATSAMWPRNAVRLLYFKRNPWRLCQGGCCLAVLALLTLLVDRRRSFRLALGLTATGILLLAFGCGGGGGGSGGGGSGGGGGSNQAPTSIAITASVNKVQASTSPSLTLTATVTSTKPVTGTITFWEIGNGGALTPPLNLVGSATSSQIALPQVGTHQIFAQYSGDPENLGSKSSTLNVVATGSAFLQIQGVTGPVIQYTNITVTIQ